MVEGMRKLAIYDVFYGKFMYILFSILNIFAMAHDFSFPLLCTHIFNNYMEFQTQHSKVLGFSFFSFFYLIFCSFLPRV